MPLPPALADWLSGDGFDAVHVSDLGMYRSADTDILALAKRENRIVITANLDFPRLLALSRDEAPALILFRGGDWSDTEIINQIKRVLAGVEEDKIANGVLTVDHKRIRWRKLPILE